MELEDINANNIIGEDVFCICSSPDFELVGYVDKLRTLVPAGTLQTVFMYPVFRCRTCGLIPGENPTPPLFLCNSCRHHYLSGCHGYALIAQFDICIVCFGYESALTDMWTWR